MPTISDLIDPFFTWKQGPNRTFAESSRLKYLPLLESFGRWTGERDVSELTTQLIEFEYLPAWTAIFEERHGRSPALNTVRLKHNALSSLLDYAWRRGLLPSNPMLAIPRPSYEPPMNDWLSAEEDLLLARVEMTPLEDIITGLGRLAGLRCAEITGLLRGHVDLSDGLLHVRGTKSPSSVRGVVIFPELAAKIESWTQVQDERGLTSPLDWFVSTEAGGRVADSYVWRVVKRVAARAGVRVHSFDERGRPLALDRAGENRSAISTHTLRRTYGSDLLNRGARIEVVSAQMGHSSTKVTEKSYTKLLTKTQQREILRLGTGYPFLANDPRRRR